MSNNDFTFDDILNEIKNEVSVKEIGSFRIKELTYEQQRSILNSGTIPAVAPAKMSNLFNNFIAEKVEFINDIASVAEHITVDKKPFFIIALRALTHGDTIKMESGEYQLYEPTASDLENPIEEKEITFGSITMRLKYPTIAEDSFYNNKIVDAVSSLSKKKTPSDEDVVKIADTYLHYEMMKYIKEIVFRDSTQTFINIRDKDKDKFMNMLPQKVIKGITDYMSLNKPNEEKAFTVTSGENMNILNPMTIFYSEPSFDIQD